MLPKERPSKDFDSDGRLIIDGSVLEGGGQILRISAALSCILKIPVRVIKIRAGREKPGLRPQHLSGLELIARICGGQLGSCAVGTTEITLDPGPVSSGQFTADTKTAGSICLLMQAALPCLLFSSHDSSLSLKGGTNCDMAPQIDYTALVFKPIAERFGMKFDLNIKRRGYFPKGGGEVIVTAHPTLGLTGVEKGLMDRGKVIKIYSRSFVAGALPEHLSQKVSQSISDTLRKSFPDTDLQQDSLKESFDKAFGSGLGTMIVAETSTGCLFGGSALGKPKGRAEDTGVAAAKELLRGLECNGCVDEYLQDQLILLMTLAKGQTQMRCGEPTLHTLTAIHIARLMTEAQFQIDQSDKGTWVIKCEGIGHPNSSFAETS